MAGIFLGDGHAEESVHYPQERLFSGGERAIGDGVGAGRIELARWYGIYQIADGDKEKRNRIA